MLLYGRLALVPVALFGLNAAASQTLKTYLILRLTVPTILRAPSFATFFCRKGGKPLHPIFRQPPSVNGSAFGMEFSSMNRFCAPHFFLRSLAPLICSAENTRPSSLQTVPPRPNQRPHNLRRAPRSSVLYRIPCTGVRPIQFAAQGLPPSLKLDRATGILSGTTPEKPGIYPVTLLATNANGKSSRLFRIVVGDTLALTPPMAEEHLVLRYGKPDCRKSPSGGRRHDSSGMADFGYQSCTTSGGGGGGGAGGGGGGRRLAR